MALEIKRSQLYKEYNKTYRETHKEHIKNYLDNWRKLHPRYQKDWRKSNIEEQRWKSREYARNHKEEQKQYNLKNRAHYYEYRKQWRKNNPRSNSHYSLDLQDAMNNVRLRDNNTCQWQGCGLTHRQSPIHVHHIFPISEYPGLQLIEQYMICYCANHHGLWHRYRGDSYSEMINSKNKEIIICQ